MCADLGLSGICIFKEPEAQLRADGYHGNNATPQVQLSLEDDGTALAAEAAALQYDAKPHELMPKLKQLVSVRSPCLHPLTLALTDAISAVKAAIAADGASFALPLAGQCRTEMNKWGALVAKAARRSSAALTHSVQTLGDLYEAARIIAVSRQGDLEVAMHHLEMLQVLAHDGIAPRPQLLGHDRGASARSAAWERLQQLQAQWSRACKTCSAAHI